MSRPKKLDSMTNAERQKKYRQQLKQRIDMLDSVSGDIAVHYLSARDRYLDDLKSRSFPLDMNNDYQVQLNERFIGCLKFDEIVSMAIGVEKYKR